MKNRDLGYKQIRWKEIVYLLDDVLSRYTENSEYAIEQFELELLETYDVKQEYLDRIELFIYTIEEDELMSMTENEKIRTFLK